MKNGLSRQRPNAGNLPNKMKNAHDIIINPVQTEKCSELSDKYGKYTFRVRMDSTKIEVEKAIEELFNVKVKKVNTVSMRGKKKRVRHREGKTPDWKKAIVTLAEGQKIDFA